MKHSLWAMIALVLMGSGFMVGRGQPRERLIQVPVEKRVEVRVPVQRTKATLADVRRDWGIDGRLDCRVVSR